MEGEEAEDPFGSLKKLCDPTASQEEKLRNCPFARELETFPISLTSSSQSWTSSEHNVIIMVSLPDSGGSIDGNTPQEDDKYHTPPEHSHSFASDSDDPKQPPPLPRTTARGGDDDRTVAVDLGKEEEEEENLGFRLDRKLEGFEGSSRGKQPPLPATAGCGGDDDETVETAFHMGDEEENLGLQSDKKLEGFDGNLRGEQPPSLSPLPPPATTICGGDDDQKMERAVDFGDEEENQVFLGSQLGRNSRDECCDCVIRDHEMEVLECELDRDRVLEGEFCEKVEKKNWVSEGNLGLGIDTVCGDETLLVENLDTEIIDVDSEECDGELGFDKQRVDVNMDSAEKELKEGDRDSKGVNLLENIEDPGGGSKVENLFLDGEEGGGDSDRENLCKKSENLCKNCEEGGRIIVGENLRENGLIGGDVRRNDNLCNDGEGGDWVGIGENVGKNGEGGDGCGEGEKLCENGEGAGGTSENGRGSDGISRGERLRTNGEEGGELRKGNLSKSVGVCEAENLGSSREGALRKALEAIEKFKYVGSGDGIEQRGKKRGVSGKSGPPLSMTGQRKDAQKEVESGNKGMKGGSFMDFLDSLKFVIREEDDGSEHDFLETAKRRGMVFPRPRWWPPEGVD